MAQLWRHLRSSNEDFLVILALPTLLPPEDITLPVDDYTGAIVLAIQDNSGDMPKLIGDLRARDIPPGDAVGPVCP